MFKLVKYLKPFTILIITAIILLFVQAMCDLSLPDYMSNIVNKGIQQGGIESAVPKAMRQSTMDKISLMMGDNDRVLVHKSYTLIDASSADYNKYMKDYPILASESIYILNQMDKEQMDALNPILGKAILAVSGFKKFTALDDNMITQAAVGPIKSEYQALGLNTDNIQNNYIMSAGVLMLLISLLSAACAVIVGLLSARAAAGLSKNLRKGIFTKVESFSNAEFDKFSTASLITRTTNDITQIQMLVIIMIRMVIYAPIMGAGGVVKALTKSSSMSWTITLAVVVLLGLIITVFTIAMPKFKTIQKLIDRLNLVTRENLTGMMVIRAFNTQEFEEKRFDKANVDLTNTNLFVNRVMVFMMPAMMLIMNGVTLLIVWVGAHQIAESSMQVGDMMAFMQYAMQILFSFLMLSMMFIMIPRASVSAQRVAEVLEIKPTIVDPEEPKALHEIEGVVEFRNVSFRYPGAEGDALKDVSFKALPGQTTAFIGSTGSGKTTLINLIPRFYDVTEGQVLIDGIDVREVTQHALREKIGYVPQKGSLFSGTIQSNLKYADEHATDEAINKAAEIAQAMEFINEKPEHFGTEISQGGANVSGGQKQRLSIARALVKKPDIYLFDDSFSALDFKTDAALREALKSQIEKSTVLIVAQRISTIMNADQIIVLEDGKIAGMGTHRELMKSCETYQEIALSQFSKEELA